MCGIAGSLVQTPQNQQQWVAAMLGQLLHRGPDGQGIATIDQGALGHQRLAILDLTEHAAQPMWDNTKRYCLVFNGEIYNYAQLKQELKTLGYQFKTRSDTEVLLAAFATWGLNALPKLTGMYAFALWDSLEKTLFLVRDRMGEKPLFYTGLNGNLQKGLLFASELKALTILPAVKQSISLAAISEYLSQNYLLTDTCIYEDIYKLPPAHYLAYRLNQTPQVIPYWHLAPHFQNKSTLSFPEATEQLLFLLKKSTRQQMCADVPVGAFLSGGIDSAAIVAQMAQQNAEKVRTFSIGFPVKSFDELPASQITAKHLQVSHQTQVVYPAIHDLLPQLAYQFDEPFADTSMIPTYLLAQFARQFVKVSLSGDGGDELFGGYATYQADRLHQSINRLPRALVKAARHLLLNYCPTSMTKISWDFKLKQFLRGCLQDFQRAHVSWRMIFSPEEKRQLFREEFRAIALQDTFARIEPFFQHVANCHPLDQAMYVDMKTWLVDDILVKVDRASMANSLEVRAPFLDHHMVEFAASLPVEYKIRGHHGKKILKQSQAGLLPQSVIRRRKEGFNSPIAVWLNNELYDMAYSATTSQVLSQWFERSTIEQLWQEHRSQRQDHSYRLFGLLNLALWLETNQIKNRSIQNDFGYYSCV